MIFIGILISIIMFSVIVILHEYGHYKSARLFWIHIEEFGLWIPPRAKKLWKNKHGTLFSLNWIPLWGFVRISWESELLLQYFWKTKKPLSHSWILKKISSWEDLFNKKWEKIKVQERKLLQARLLSQRPGENFYEKHIFARSIVLLAGVVMNFLLAIVIFSSLFILWVKPVWINTYIDTSIPSKLIPSLDTAIENWLITKSDGIILSPLAWSISEESWILPWDILLRVDEKGIESIKYLQEYIANNEEKELTFYINRNTECPAESTSLNCPIIEYLNIKITPNKDGKIGTYLSENLLVDQDFEYKYSLWESIKYWAYETYAQIRLTLSWLSLLLKNIFNPETPEEREQALDSVAWPIGIVSVITQSLEWGIMLLFILAWVISINLWVFNLLPIPALDGGRLLLLWIRSAIDKVFWKTALSWAVENLVHVMFFLILIALSILIAYNDIIRIFSQ